MNLNEELVKTHRIFDRSIPLGAVKVILRYLDDDGSSLYVGDTNGSIGLLYRYMRIVIDIPAGSKTSEEKKALLTMVSACCVRYQRDKVETCEIEIRLNEVDLDDVVLAGKRPVGINT